MSEIELKFQIPAQKHKAFRLAFQRKKPEPVQLQAKYFDTADHCLQQRKIALRQRLENHTWLQTLKAPKSAIERIEIESELGEQEPAAIDLAMYLQDAKLKKLLEPLLQPQSPLQLQFETRIQRQRFIQKTADSEIELAFDQGEIIAGPRSAPVNEIEFELKQGSIHELIQAVQPWVEKYQIWLDSSSKALKGQMLQQALQAPPVQYQNSLTLHADDRIGAALPKIIANCLEHLLPNSSAIAGQQYEAGHVHQARVAIRRMRSALKTFGQWVGRDTQAWQDQLAELFRQLGATRDRDALAASLIPQLQLAGSPVSELPVQAEAVEEDISALFRAPKTTLLLLELIEFSHQPQDGKSRLKKQSRRQLNKMHQQICQAESAFEQLQAEEKHRLRKRVKRLRYSVEFIASLYPQSAMKPYLKALKPLQESLGRFNDLTVAHALFEQDTGQHPQSWFVLGWIASEQHHIEQQIQQDLTAFCQAQCFWQ